LALTHLQSHAFFSIKSRSLNNARRLNSASLMSASWLLVPFSMLVSEQAQAAMAAAYLREGPNELVDFSPLSKAWRQALILISRRDVGLEPDLLWTLDDSIAPRMLRNFLKILLAISCASEAIFFVLDNFHMWCVSCQTPSHTFKAIGCTDATAARLLLPNSCSIAFSTSTKFLSGAINLLCNGMPKLL